MFDKGTGYLAISKGSELNECKPFFFKCEQIKKKSDREDEKKWKSGM